MSAMVSVQNEIDNRNAPFNFKFKDFFSIMYLDISATYSIWSYRDSTSLDLVQLFWQLCIKLFPNASYVVSRYSICSHLLTQFAAFLYKITFRLKLLSWLFCFFIPQLHQKIHVNSILFCISDKFIPHFARCSHHFNLRISQNRFMLFHKILFSL